MNTIELNNGIKMPMLGYGVFLVGPQECEHCVSEAIRLGYRLIDTAQAYYNEEGVGAAISKCGILAISATIVSPEISSPRQKASADL